MNRGGILFPWSHPVLWWIHVGAVSGGQHRPVIPANRSTPAGRENTSHPTGVVVFPDLSAHFPAATTLSRSSFPTAFAYRSSTSTVGFFIRPFSNRTTVVRLCPDATATSAVVILA